MYDAHKNFAYTVVTVAPDPATTGTSLTVADGTIFPTAPFNATVWPNNADPLPTNAEIVRVTAVVGDVLTIVRTQEGSTARSIAAGDQIANTFTAKVLTDLENAPCGEINFFSLAGTAVAITAQSTTGTNNAVKIDVASALTPGSYEFDNGGSNDGRLRYTGAMHRMFHVAGSVSFSAGNSDTFTIMFAKNGTVVTTSTIAMRKMGAAGDVGSTALHAFIELSTNEYIELFVANNTDADDPTFHSLNLFALGM